MSSAACFVVYYVMLHGAAQFVSWWYRPHAVKSSRNKMRSWKRDAERSPATSRL